jgi:HEAT repeat protein
VAVAGAAYDRAFAEAAEAGDFEEDRSAGHSLLHYPAARRAQEALIPLATRHEARLREVLRDASDPAHRARAAEVLGYHPDKRAVVPDLVAAVDDPDPGVRNDAVRALAVIAVLDAARPELGIGVPAEPFTQLVNSAVWTDRNKGSLALASVTERRDPAVLARLRRDALPALIEMGRWKSPGHATPALLILGRIADMPDDEVFAAIQRGERDSVIRAARGKR